MTPLLFDGQLRVYSTCRGCGEIMQVTNPSDKAHPLCEYLPTKLDSLATGWLSCTMASDYEAAELTKKEMDQLSPQTSDLGDAAIAYTLWNWPVFPLAKHSKLPAVSKANGGQGFKDAKTDTDRIARWWDRHPDHNIGLATGHAFDAVDIDTRHGGAQSFAEVLRRGNVKFDCHGIAITASGGLHLYVPATGKGNFVNMYPGIDFRGLGGYCVAPPSTLGSPGRSYSWLCEPSPALKGAR
jgi:hypothetical protein